MAIFKIKIESTQHGAISAHHNDSSTGDMAWCHPGEDVFLRWQPSAGWGLKEAHYEDQDGNVVQIEGGVFTMPASDIVIGGTFKRFTVEDWTTGAGTDMYDGKILGMDGKGNLVPVAMPVVSVVIPVQSDMQAGSEIPIRNIVVAGAKDLNDALTLVNQGMAPVFFSVCVTDSNNVIASASCSTVMESGGRTLFIGTFGTKSSQISSVHFDFQLSFQGRIGEIDLSGDGRIDEFYYDEV